MEGFRPLTRDEFAELVDTKFEATIRQWTQEADIENTKAAANRGMVGALRWGVTRLQELQSQIRAFPRWLPEDEPTSGEEAEVHTGTPPLPLPLIPDPEAPPPPPPNVGAPGEVAPACTDAGVVITTPVVDLPGPGDPSAPEPKKRGRPKKAE